VVFVDEVIEVIIGSYETEKIHENMFLGRSGFEKYIYSDFNKKFDIDQFE